MTICVDCKHFKNLEPHSDRADIWYNHLCLASPLEKKRNPVTGKVESIGSQHDFAYCCNINNGNCAKYEANEED